MINVQIVQNIDKTDLLVFFNAPKAWARCVSEHARSRVSYDDQQ